MRGFAVPATDYSPEWFHTTSGNRLVAPIVRNESSLTRINVDFIADSASFVETDPALNDIIRNILIASN